MLFASVDSRLNYWHSDNDVHHHAHQTLPSANERGEGKPVQITGGPGPDYIAFFLSFLAGKDKVLPRTGHEGPEGG
jgi:hypothetical protein